jgi:hypothetical protein
MRRGNKQSALYLTIVCARLPMLDIHILLLRMIIKIMRLTCSEMIIMVCMDADSRVLASYE